MFVKVLGVKDTAMFLAAHAARLQHISHSHVVLGPPVLLPICLGGTVPACESVGSLARHRGFAWAGSTALQWHLFCMTWPSMGALLLHTSFHSITPVDCHVPKQRSKAEDRKQPHTHTHFCLPLRETRKQQWFENFHAVTEESYSSCIPLTEPDFLGTSLQNRCKVPPSMTV